jgi:cell wall-associated NlpC family hydrolase
MPGSAAYDPNMDVEGTEDRDIWARSLVDAAVLKKKKVPRAVDLEQAMTSINISDELKGSSTITIGVHDENWELVDSGFFDADKDGRLDKVEVNYPENSRFWWRLTQVGIDEANRGGADVTLTFMERAAVQMMEKRGPLKIVRGATTRAEFLMRLVKTSTHPRLTYISKQLHKTQPIGTGRERVNDKKQRRQAEKQVKDEERRSAKEQGLHKNSDLKIKGAQANKAQLRRAEVLLDTCRKLEAPNGASLGILCAAIAESTMGEDRGARGTTLQTYAFPESNLAGQATAWLKGGHSFQGGGGIALAKQGLGPGEIATRVEAGGMPANFYGKYRPEAEALLKAYGGGGFNASGATFERKAVYFKVGKRETYWDAAVRLADEVDWDFFIDGDHAYFDSELTLIKQKPVLVIHRNDPELVNWSSNWDARQIATEMTLSLICAPFEFRAGEVFQLASGFGMASSGSTAELPGRWLIEKAERDRFDFATTFTLKQPTKPKNEPLGELISSSGGAGAGGPLRDRIVQVAKDSMTSKTGFRRYSQAGRLTDDPTPPAGARTDCSQWVRAVYLKAGAGDPDTYTGAMMQKAKRTSHPKPGDIFVSSSHVELFIGNGKTIGHGSPPIDYNSVSWCRGRGMVAMTYDFLDDDSSKKRKKRHGSRSPSHAGNGDVGNRQPIGGPR